ncbi:hypothetical protein AOLI_G00127260 [Acnodon oligacanthus]
MGSIPEKKKWGAENSDGSSHKTGPFCVQTADPKTKQERQQPHTRIPTTVRRAEQDDQSIIGLISIISIRFISIFSIISLIVKARC